jgi:hypothetical protein
MSASKTNGSTTPAWLIAIRPASIDTNPVSNAPSSTRMLMAIMACIRVGGGGIVSDQGS